MSTRWMVRNATIELGNLKFGLNLIVLPGLVSDVILGMNWMKLWKAVLDTDCRTLSLIDPRNGSKFQVHLPQNTDLVNMSYATQVVELSKIPVVCEFPDVFPDELLGLPPDRDVEFKIELIPGTTPISRKPFRMSPDKLVELRTQLKELLDKVLIQQSSSE